MQEGNNAINNYKGVMLCSRPNEGHSNGIEKPFCARVVPGEQLGLVPCGKQHQIQSQYKKPKKQILNRHKKWLQQFKSYMNKKTQQKDEKQKQDKEKMQRIKQQAEGQRQRARKMKQEYNVTANNVINILDDEPIKTKQAALTSQNLKKLNEYNDRQQSQQQIFKKKKKQDKPLWAQTKKQIEDKQEKEVDDLLNFFEQNNVEDYSQDEEVKLILNNLKKKISDLKKEENWKENQTRKINTKKNIQPQNNEDVKSVVNSMNSQGAKSVASERSQKRVQQLRARQTKQQEWDKHTTSQKSVATNVQDRIAKNIADQVLRSYPNMRGVHSNTSVRRLLEQQAAKAICQPIVRPVITTVVKQKNHIDANNLPYLHRNPAI